ATACPAIVSVADRALALAFSVKATVTVPLPVPGAPPVIEIHPRSDAAVQAHPAVVVTVTVPAPAADPNDIDVAESEYVQEAGGSVGPTGDVSWQAQAIMSIAAGKTMRLQKRGIAVSREAIATSLPGRRSVLE